MKERGLWSRITGFFELMVLQAEWGCGCGCPPQPVVGDFMFTENSQSLALSWLTQPRLYENKKVDINPLGS